MTQEKIFGWHFVEHTSASDGRSVVVHEITGFHPNENGPSGGKKPT
jgi:hypothetical protein